MYIVYAGLNIRSLLLAMRTVVKWLMAQAVYMENWILKYIFKNQPYCWSSGSFCMFSFYLSFFPPSSFLDSRQPQCHMSDCEIRWSIYNFKIFVTQLSQRDLCEWVEHKGWQAHRSLLFGFYCIAKTQSFCPQNQSYAHCAIRSLPFFFF